MQKVFYVSRNSGDGSAPDLDRFARIEQLNRLIALGWRITSFVNEDNNVFFILEKS